MFEIVLPWINVLSIRPKARFEEFRLLSAFPSPMYHPAVTFPVTERVVRVPTDVILVWSVWSCEAASAPIATLDAFRLLSVFPDPTNHPAVTLLVTRRAVSVPTDVIFVWLFWRRAALIAPNAIFDAFRLLKILGKRSVTFANAIFDMVFPYISALLIIPVVILDAFRLVSEYPSPAKVPALTLPLTVRSVNVPTEVIFVWLLWR